MHFQKLMEEISMRFLEAWDNREFDVLRSLLSNEIRFESPNIPGLVPGAEGGAVTGVEETIDYLRRLSVAEPDFRFHRDQSVFNKTDRTMIMQGVMRHNDKPIVAEYRLNEYGKFSSISIRYPEGFR
jgi:hypothetical protein